METGLLASLGTMRFAWNQNGSVQKLQQFDCLFTSQCPDFIEVSF